MPRHRLTLIFLPTLLLTVSSMGEATNPPWPSVDPLEGATEIDVHIKIDNRPHPIGPGLSEELFQDQDREDSLQAKLTRLVRERVSAEGFELFPETKYQTKMLNVDGKLTPWKHPVPGGRRPLEPADRYLDTNLAYHQLRVDINGAHLDLADATHLAFFQIELGLCVSFLRSDPTRAQLPDGSIKPEYVLRRSLLRAGPCQLAAYSDYAVAPFRASRFGAAQDSELEGPIEHAVGHLLDKLFATHSDQEGLHDVETVRAWESEDGRYDIEAKPTRADDLYEYLRGTPLLEPWTLSIYPKAGRAPDTPPAYEFQLRERKGYVEQAFLPADLSVVAVIPYPIGFGLVDSSGVRLFHPEGNLLHDFSQRMLLDASPLRDLQRAGGAPLLECLRHILRHRNQREPFIDPQNRLVIPVADCRRSDDPEAFVELRVRLEDGVVESSP